jgi:hypothetical protein
LKAGGLGFHDDATAWVEVGAAMNAVGVTVREGPVGREGGGYDYRSPVLAGHDLGWTNPLFTPPSFVAHGAGKVAKELHFPFALFGEYIGLPFEERSYDIGVHGLEHF